MEQKVIVNAQDIHDTNFAWAKIVKLEDKYYVVVGNLRSDGFDNLDEAYSYCDSYPNKIIEMAIGYLLIKVKDWRNENE